MSTRSIEQVLVPELRSGDILWTNPRATRPDRSPGDLVGKPEAALWMLCSPAMSQHKGSASSWWTFEHCGCGEIVSVGRALQALVRVLNATRLWF